MPKSRKHIRTVRRVVRTLQTAIGVEYTVEQESAIALAARKRKIALPAVVSIDAEVDLNLGHGGYFLSTRLNVRLPGLERNVAKHLLEEAEVICPYSKAICDNIEVTINLSEPDYSPVS